MTYLRNLLIALDQLANALLAGSCDEFLTMSNPKGNRNA